MIYSNIAEYEEGDSKLAKQTILDLHKEIERLNNIINELEKWLDEEYQYADKHIFPGSMAGVIMGQINRTKSKLQELKDSDKE